MSGKQGSRSSKACWSSVVPLATMLVTLMFLDLAKFLPGMFESFGSCSMMMLYGLWSDRPGSRQE